MYLYFSEGLLSTVSPAFDSEAGAWTFKENLIHRFCDDATNAAVVASEPILKMRKVRDGQHHGPFKEIGNENGPSFVR